MASDFDAWLFNLLDSMQIDRDVMGPYILTLLGDEEEEDLNESLDELLSSYTPDPAPVRADILRKWKEASTEQKTDTELAEKAGTLDLNAAMNSIAESKSAEYRASKAPSGPGSGPDSSVKAAILAQYGGREEEEDDDDGDSDEGVAVNSNAAAVAQADAEKREKSKQASAAKKEKDKEDRENQKKSQEERKKKAQEKTAKGERRRC